MMLAPLSQEAADQLRFENALLRTVVELVREYPDFDEGGPLAEAMDMALRGEVHDMIKLIVFVRQNYTVVDSTT